MSLLVTGEPSEPGGIRKIVRPQREPLVSYVVCLFDSDWMPSADLRVPFAMAEDVRLQLIRGEEFVQDGAVERAFRAIGRGTFPERRIGLYLDVRTVMSGVEDKVWQLSAREDYGARLRRANLALWLARPSSVAVEVVLSVERYDEEVVLYSAADNPPEYRIVSDGRDARVQLTQDQLALARLLHNALAGDVGRSVDVAVRVLWRALTEPTWDLRYLLLWIGLEALFGFERNVQGVGRRLARRISGFLFPEDLQAAASLCRVVETAYALRSSIAHGQGPLSNRAIDAGVVPDAVELG